MDLFKLSKVALFQTGDNGGKVVIRNDRDGRRLGGVGSNDNHGKADVSLLQSRAVVDTIYGHSCEMAPIL